VGQPIAVGGLPLPKQQFLFVSAYAKLRGMNGLTLFGLGAVTLMLVTYALEKRSHWFILAFSACCVLASVYGFLQGAWPFGMVEAIWSLVALRRWLGLDRA